MRLSFLLLLMPTIISAQVAAGLTIAPGAEVRVSTVNPQARVRGRLVALGVDTIRLDPKGDAGTTTYRFDNIRRLEVRGGEDKRRGFVIGASILGGIGLVFGGIDYSKGELTRDDYFGAIVSNALIGGLVGYVFAPKGWTDIPLTR